MDIVIFIAGLLVGAGFAFVVQFVVNKHVKGSQDELYRLMTAEFKNIATDIFNTYNTIYGATSAWDMCNAISYVAKGLDVDTRCAFEAKCLL